jgi:signal transduction histidine kinase
MLSGGRLAPRIGDLDPVRLVRHAAARVLGDFEADGVELDLLVPAQLPPARGDAAALESVLVQLLRSRLRAAQPGASFTLAARLVGGGARPEVRISLVDPPGREGLAPSPALELGIAASGGRVHTLADPVAGRVTALQIPTSRQRP